VDAQAIACPHCRMVLKAYGHPGMTLHRATEDGYLCTTCVYHEDDTCNFPQRPFAKDCTLYNKDTTQTPPPSGRSGKGFALKTWWRRNTVWIALSAIVLLSVLLTLLNSSANQSQQSPPALIERS